MTSVVSPPPRMPLAKLRIDRGLTREQLAARAGLAARTIYGIEREGVHPQRATIRVLAEALGCDPALIGPRNDERASTGRPVKEPVEDGNGHGGS